MTISVGLPFHNSVLTLERAIRSVFAQTYEDWELILVDDGSTDGSLDLARSVRDPRVRVLSDGVNLGLARRLNQLAASTDRPLMARMDADDLMHPERLFRQLEFLDRHDEVDLVGTAAVAIDGDDRPYALRNSNSDLSPRSVLARGLFIHPTVTGKTSWFRRHPYDPSYVVRGEDRELWCRTIHRGGFAVMDEPLLFYRESGNFRLSVYIAACRGDRRIFRVYGPSTVGWPATLGLLAKGKAKELTYRAVSSRGARRLVERRGTPLTGAQRAEAARALEQVRSAAVPGLDGRR